MVATPGDMAQYASWGWSDAAEALARVRVPIEPATALGPIDEALLAAAPDARVADLTAKDGRRVTSADVYLDGVTLRIGATAVAIERERDPGDRRPLADGASCRPTRWPSPPASSGRRRCCATSGCTHPALGQGLRNHVGLPVTLRLDRRPSPWTSTLR